MPAWTVSKSKSHHAQLITVQLIAEAQTCTRTRVRMTKQGKPSVKLGSSKNEHAQTSQKKKHTKPFLAHSAGCFVGFFLFVGDLVCAVPTAKTPAILLDSAPIFEPRTSWEVGHLLENRSRIRKGVDLSGSTDDLTHSIMLQEIGQKLEGYYKYNGEDKIESQRTIRFFFAAAAQ